MGGYEHLALVGTTAVVALVGNRMIYVANCGDSRAVLCRSGGALPLTDDHKAAREDETVGSGDCASFLLLSSCGLITGKSTTAHREKQGRACKQLSADASCGQCSCICPQHLWWTPLWPCVAGSCGGGWWADSVLEWRARHGAAGSVACHWRPLAAAIRHCGARGELKWPRSALLQAPPLPSSACSCLYAAVWPCCVQPWHVSTQRLNSSRSSCSCSAAVGVAFLPRSCAALSQPSPVLAYAVLCSR